MNKMLLSLLLLFQLGTIFSEVNETEFIKNIRSAPMRRLLELPYDEWVSEVRKIHTKLYRSLVEDFQVDITTPSIKFFERLIDVMYIPHYWDKSLEEYGTETAQDLLRQTCGGNRCGNSRMDYENQYGLLDTRLESLLCLETTYFGCLSLQNKPREKQLQELVVLEYIFRDLDRDPKMCIGAYLNGLIHIDSLMQGHSIFVDEEVNWHVMILGEQSLFDHYFSTITDENMYPICGPDLSQCDFDQYRQIISTLNKIELGKKCLQEFEDHYSKILDETPRPPIKEVIAHLQKDFHNIKEELSLMKKTNIEYIKKNCLNRFV